MIRTKKALVTLAIAGIAALGTAGTALATSGHAGSDRGASAQLKDTTPQALPFDEALPVPVPN
ncbi:MULTISPECIES: hypothetical protein [Streptomyces]|uniref:Small secreted domain n=1 Tax=Streptomyces lonegramiae TaxID=3075524 RepID=A0ABU2XUR9_9ACTN|nr:hypothetical protein [Streptomyces sp. DSM 41529]MDT0549646.1 hypothetical protein [Streptomyces sp. DSM 41529]